MSLLRQVPLRKSSAGFSVGRSPRPVERRHRYSPGARPVPRRPGQRSTARRPPDHVRRHRTLAPRLSRSPNAGGPMYLTAHTSSGTSLVSTSGSLADLVPKILPGKVCALRARLAACLVREVTMRCCHCAFQASYHGGDGNYTFGLSHHLLLHMVSIIMFTVSDVIAATANDVVAVACACVSTPILYHSSRDRGRDAPHIL